MTVAEVPLVNLHENDYNPRERFDDAAMEDLKNSIEKIGLIQPPTVRPLGNGDYEVIAGTRRFKALSELYGDDHVIDVYVRDVDDDKAKWIAISENLERENLDPIEKARAYASYVWVSPRGERINFLEYIKEARVADTNIVVPGHINNESVSNLAENVPATEQEIAHRLELLALPKEVQTMVQHDELTVTAGLEISRLRQIPDADARDQFMTSLAGDYTGELTSTEGDDLRNRVNAYLEDFKEEKKRKKRNLQEFEDLVDEREVKLRSTLTDACEWYNGHDVTDEQLIPNGDGVADEAQEAIDAFQDAINRLGGRRLDHLDDRHDRLLIDKERVERAIQVVQDENHERCPFCKAGVSVPELQDRVETYKEEIKGIRDEKEGLNDQREEFREQRKELRTALNRHEDAVERLEQEKAA